MDLTRGSRAALSIATALVVLAVIWGAGCGRAVDIPTTIVVGGFSPDTPAAPPVEVPASTTTTTRPVTTTTTTTGVRVTLPAGKIVTTGQAEAETAVPVNDPESYDLRICLQLQAAQPWMRWTCP